MEKYELTFEEALDYLINKNPYAVLLSDKKMQLFNAPYHNKPCVFAPVLTSKINYCLADNRRIINSVKDDKFCILDRECPYKDIKYILNVIKPFKTEEIIGTNSFPLVSNFIENKCNFAVKNGDRIIYHCNIDKKYSDKILYYEVLDAPEENTRVPKICNFDRYKLDMFSIKEVVDYLINTNPFAVFKNKDDVLNIKNMRYGSDNIVIPTLININSNTFLNKNITVIESKILDSNFYLSNEINELEETSYVVDLNNMYKLKDIDTNSTFPLVSDMINEKVNIITKKYNKDEDYISVNYCFGIDNKLSKDIVYYSCKKISDILIKSVETFNNEKENLHIERINEEFKKIIDSSSFKGLTDMYFKEAEEEMEKSNCLRRKYGAVLVSKDDEILSKECNRVPEGDEPCKEKCYRESIGINHGERYEVCKTVHAEQACLITADPKKIKDSTLYLVGREADGSFINDISCCSLCLRMLKYAGVSKVVYQLNNTSYKQIELRKEE